jgi:hypothetical protein
MVSLFRDRSFELPPRGAGIEGTFGADGSSLSISFPGLADNSKLILIVRGWSSHLRSRAESLLEKQFFRDRCGDDDEDDEDPGEDSHPSSAETVAG